ncbi:MAG: hypothetical protein DRP30_01415 [Thermotoga sp.]|nr:MAG: hypothetical protein DRP30_01415 [Thermotoga sp.]HDM70199.1 hypothetical protein [Thermotogales bacterium]
MRRFLVFNLILLMIVSISFSVSKVFTGEQILKLGTVLANTIEELGKKLPDEITVPGTKEKVSMEEALYLMTKWLALYGENGKKVGVIPKEVQLVELKKPEKMIMGAQGGKIWWDDIYKLTKELVEEFEKNPGIPPQIKILNDRKEDVITADVLIYLLARTIRWVDNNKRMPNYASIRPVVPPPSWPPVEKPEVKIEKVPAKPGEIRGIWVWYDTLGKVGVEKAMKEIHDLGFTDVFLLVKGISGKVCWESPSALGFWEDTSILRRAVKSAHEYGMKLHAWFVVSKDKTYLALYPESGMYGIPLEEGMDFRRAKSTIDFAVDSAYRRYVEDLMKQVLLRYDVDGIHLDYIRYPTGAWGWGPYQIGRAWMEGLDLDFLLKTAIETWGNKGDGKKFIEMYKEFRYYDINAWVQMRMDDVRNFVKEIHDAVKSVKPDVILSAALMPEGGDTDPNANAFAMVHYGQRYSDFGEFCQFLIPMTYHLEFGKKAQWIIDVYKGTKEVVPPEVKILMGVQGYDISPIELQKAIYASRQAGADGFVVFRYGSLNDELKKAILEAIK